MKKFSLLVLFILVAITLANCSPKSQQSIQGAVESISTIVSTVAVKPAPTKTILPTRIKTLLPSSTKTHTIEYPASMGTSIPKPNTPIIDDHISDAKILAQLGNGTVLGMELSPDLKSLYVLTTTGVFEYDAITIEFKNKIIFQSPMIHPCFSISPDGKYIVVVGEDIFSYTTTIFINRVLVFDTKSYSISLSTQIFEKDEFWGGGVSFSNNGDEIICWTFEGDIAVINTKTGEITEGNKIKYVDISADGKTASISGQGLLNLEENKGISLREYGKYSSGSFSPDGKFVYSVSIPYIKIWDIDQDLIIGRLKVPKFSGNSSSAISPDHRYFANTQSTTTYVWEIQSGKLVYTFNTPDNGFSLSFSGDSQKLLVSVPAPTWQFWPSIVKDDNREMGIYLWNLADGSLDQIIPGYDNWMREVAFSPDGKILAAGGDSSNVLLWNVPEFTLNTKINTGIGVQDLVFSPDGQYLLTAKGNIFQLWKTSTWEKVFESTTGAEWFGPMVAFSSDSKMFGVALKQRIRIYDVKNLKLLMNFDGMPVDKFSQTQFSFSDNNANISIQNGDDVWVYGIEKGKLIEKQKNRSLEEINIEIKRFYYIQNILLNGWVSSMNEKLLTINQLPRIGIAISPDYSFIAGTNISGVVWIWGIEP